MLGPKVKILWNINIPKARIHSRAICMYIYRICGHLHLRSPTKVWVDLLKDFWSMGVHSPRFSEPLSAKLRWMRMQDGYGRGVW